MSNRQLKLRLYKKNPFCHYCNKKMILTDEPQLKGEPNPLMCTVEHLISRLNIGRWLKRKPGQKRKVLACYKCNHEKSVKEILSMSRAEVLKRSKGYSLSPHGKPKIIKPLKTLREVKQELNRIRHEPKIQNAA